MSADQRPVPPEGAPVSPAQADRPKQEQNEGSASSGCSGRMHVHSSYVWLGSLKSAVFTLFVLAVSAGGAVVSFIWEMFDESDGDGLLIAGVALLFVLLLLVAFAIALLYRYFAYKNLFFELTEDEFNLYSGILNKKRVHVPYYRVQSVDQNASLVNRVLGICSVKIDTAGGASNKAIVVPYITNAQAEWLRTELFARKLVALKAQGAQAGEEAEPSNILDSVTASVQRERGIFGGEGFDLGSVSHEYGLTNKELFLTGVSNSGSFVIVLLGLLAGAGQLVGSLSVFAPADGALESFAQDALAHEGINLVLGGMASVVVLALLLWFFSGVFSCISYGGFKARRRGDRIEVEYGLLQHRFQGVNIDRVQSLTVKQSFIRRLFGYCEISVGKIDSAEGSSSNEQKQLAQGMVVHPFVKVSRVPEVVEGLLPEFAKFPDHERRVAPVALRRVLLRRSLWNGVGFWTAVFGTVALAFIYLGLSSEDVLTLQVEQVFRSCATAFYCICLVLLVLDIVSAILWYRGSSFALNDVFAQVTNSGFTKERVVFPRKKIQFATTSANPFQRRSKVVTLTARTAAGVGGTNVSLRDISCEDGFSWLDWNLPRGPR